MKNFVPKIKAPINKQIFLDGSKSISNRALIIAAISQGNTEFENLPNSADVLACISALEELGCNLEHNQDAKTLSIQGSSGVFKNLKSKVFCNESGTLTRFIIPMLAVQPRGEYYVYAKPRMMERPLEDQLVALENLGMTAVYHEKNHKMPLTILAKSLKGGYIEVKGEKSSQFASGLLMAGALMQNGISLRSISDHKQPYLEMTTKVMAEFGVPVDINSDENLYNVKNSPYIFSGKYIIEPDVSTASYFWAIAAITGSTIKVMNITKNSKQGDIKFLEVLEKIGCQVRYYDDGIEVTGSDEIRGIEVNMRNFSDTFMTLAAIACFAQGDTYISGLSHTRGQESDRIAAMSDGLTKLGIYVETTQDSILISPSRSSFKPAIVDSYNDHRIAMSLSLLGLKYDGVIINNAEAVSKTCPDYFARMRSLID